MENFTASNPFREYRRWQLFMVSDTGVTRAVKPFKSLAVTMAFSFITAIALIIVISFLTNIAVNSRSSLKDSLSSLHSEISKLQEDADLLSLKITDTEARKFVLQPPEEIIHEEEKKKSVKEDLADQIEQPPVSVEEVVIEALPEESSTEIIEEEAAPLFVNPKVAIEDFYISENKDTKEMVANFIIKNKTVNATTVSGHIFVLLQPEAKDDSGWIISPPSEIILGKPVDSSMGLSFSIARYRFVNLKLEAASSDKKYNKSTVLIFSRKGELILEKSFPLSLKRPVTS